MRVPATDGVAIVGVYSAPYARDRRMSLRSMLIEAGAGAIRDAGLTPDQIDGIAGTNVVQTKDVQSGLRLPAVTWWSNTRVVFIQQLVEAVNAIAAGACTTALVYHGTIRTTASSRGAGDDPFRRGAGGGINPTAVNPDAADGQNAYGAWAQRYLHDTGLRREDVFGRIAVNGRSWAIENEHAAMRRPLTMEDYAAEPLLRGGLSRFDMDLPVDGADAFVLTSLSRARDLVAKPVIVHNAVMGQTLYSNEEQLPDFDSTGQSVAIKALWERSDYGLADVDLLYPYDGFTIITARWLEVIGYCKFGETADFLQSNWDSKLNRIMIDGRVPVNTHGGSLSDGGTQGVGHVREATLQLMGRSGNRQVNDPKLALIPCGGLFYNSSAAILRVE